MVPKSTRESETIARSWDRKTKALSPAPPAAFLRVIRWGGASTVRRHGSCLQTTTQLPRRSTKPPTRDKHEYTKFSTATLTNGSRGNAWSERSAAILKRCVRNLNWKGPYSGISVVFCLLLWSLNRPLWWKRFLLALARFLQIVASFLFQVMIFILAIILLIRNVNVNVALKYMIAFSTWYTDYTFA